MTDVDLMVCVDRFKFLVQVGVPIFDSSGLSGFPAWGGPSHGTFFVSNEKMTLLPSS